MNIKRRLIISNTVMVIIPFIVTFWLLVHLYLFPHIFQIKI